MATTAPAEAMPAASARRRTLARLGPFLGLVVVIAIFALMTDSPSQYLSIRNFRIVVAQTVIVALGAIGMTMIIVSGGIDLSVGSAIALTGVVTALVLRAGLPPASLAELHRLRDHQSLAVPIAVLADLVAEGMPREQATREVFELAREGRPDDEFVALRRRVQNQ
jgi:ribose/xylose/arabinose/galactoside ABC-type transport system permease subunit